MRPPSLSRARRGLVAGIAAAVLLQAVSCGMKAPPQPRELVVPAPVEDVAVKVVPEGLEITFTLPSKSLDGSLLAAIGGYRVLRDGPEGLSVRDEVRFSVSEMRRRVGKPVSLTDAPPAKAGMYRYCVLPVDFYGSHPARRRVLKSCWEGFLEEPAPAGFSGPRSGGGR